MPACMAGFVVLGSALWGTGTLLAPYCAEVLPSAASVCHEMQRAEIPGTLRPGVACRRTGERVCENVHNVERNAFRASCDHVDAGAVRVASGVNVGRRR